MALSLAGHDLLTHPEFVELTRGLDPDATIPGLAAVIERVVNEIEELYPEVMNGERERFDIDDCPRAAFSR